ncbi:2772_t:CDS:2, partial [Acaulospora morrowiae]
MTAMLKSEQYSNFVSPNLKGVHSYFKTKEAQDWRIKNYLVFCLEEDKLILPWAVVYDDWQRSLKILVKASAKQIPGSVRAFCADLIKIDSTVEGIIVLETCKNLYKGFRDQFLDLEIDARIQKLETLFSPMDRSKMEQPYNDIDIIRINALNLMYEATSYFGGDVSTDDNISDDEKNEMLLAEVTDGILAKKLSEVGKGVARYNVIFIPENIIPRATFYEEWQTLEKIFSQKEEEITSKISSPIKEVENILDKYREALVNATHRGYVKLDSVFIDYDFQNGFEFQRNWLEYWVNNVYWKFLICFSLSKHVLIDGSSSEYQYRDWFVNLLLEDLFLDINCHIRLKTGEVENIHRKNQKILSNLSDDRQHIDWYHDGILTVDINGVEEYIGILEVVGNAVVEDHIKMVSDRDKILKAMRLALFQLEQIFRCNGMNDEKQLQNNLETFGILVYGRHFIIYAMHYYEGLYLVDETDLSFILPSTPMELYLVEGIIKRLLVFRARVEYLRTWIQTQIRLADTTTRHLRRITTPVMLSPGTPNVNQRFARINGPTRNRE